jgi:hypothetical protein
LTKGAYFLKNESAMPVYRHCGHVIVADLTFSGHQYIKISELFIVFKGFA